MSSVRKTLKTLVWSAQKRSISCEICPENNQKIRRLFIDCFPAKFTLKIPAKSTDSSAILSPKITRNLTFFPANYQKPWLMQLKTLSITGKLGKNTASDPIIIASSMSYTWPSTVPRLKKIWIVHYYPFEVNCLKVSAWARSKEEST